MIKKNAELNPHVKTWAHLLTGEKEQTLIDSTGRSQENSGDRWSAT